MAQRALRIADIPNRVLIIISLSDRFGGFRPEIHVILTDIPCIKTPVPPICCRKFRLRYGEMPTEIHLINMTNRTTGHRILASKTPLKASKRGCTSAGASAYGPISILAGMEKQEKCGVEGNFP